MLAENFLTSRRALGIGTVEVAREMKGNQGMKSRNALAHRFVCSSSNRPPDSSHLSVVPPDAPDSIQPFLFATSSGIQLT